MIKLLGSRATIDVVFDVTDGRCVGGVIDDVIDDVPWRGRPTSIETNERRVWSGL